MMIKQAINIIMGDLKKTTSGKTIPIMTYFGSRLKQLGIMEALYWSNNEPDVLLGFLPLYDVQYFEVGRSQSLLQFRSVGAEFMAFQEGGNVGIRVDFDIVGPLQNVILSLLIALMEYSTETIDAVDTIINKLGKRMTPHDMEEIRWFKMDAVRKDTVHFVSDDVLTYDNNKWIRTFPLMTRNDIIFDVFIETFSFRRKEEFGKEVIECNLLLRQFSPKYINVSKEYVLQATKKRRSTQFKLFKKVNSIPVVGSSTKYKWLNPQLIDMFVNMAHRIGNAFATYEDYRDAGLSVLNRSIILPIYDFIIGQNYNKAKIVVGIYGI